MKKLLITAALVLMAGAAQAQNSLNPYGNDTNSPKLIAPNGQFLGNVNANQFDPNSIANPYGQYGSKYAPDSVNNQFGQYGSPYSPTSVRSPYGH